jgi:hypothetical protein
VLIAATDGLYSDLFNMAHGELDVTTAKTMEDDDPDVLQGPATKKDKLSNLSFAQRRHELSWRLAMHGKALAQVAALTAAAQSTELAQAARVSTKALQHARTAWVQADEAQDALYFFHAQLFPARQAPHDVYGALDVLQEGVWKDLPTDLKLVTDRYEMSREARWSAAEVQQQWFTAVRDKLIRGEVGERKLLNQEVMYKISLHGGVVRLTYGTPKETTSEDEPLYPLVAHLTVLSTSAQASWTLLSLELRVQAKTGESNHQLDMTNKQRLDLHRLCAKAMQQEELRAQEEGDRTSRPLDCMFQVAHNVLLSWQLEIWSAQAKALEKGVWSSSLRVTSVRFSGHSEGEIGVVSVSFWKVDDRYGSPKMSYINLDEHKDDTCKPPSTSQLSLSIRAMSDVGIQVAISGGEMIQNRVQYDVHSRMTMERLLDAASNPFMLSASNSILAATTLSAQQRCHAMVEALSLSQLPSWMRLYVESGCISVSAKVSYSRTTSAPTILFRLACDARTGNFVGTFCRSAKLLWLLTSNEPSEAVALRIAKLGNRKGPAALTSGRVVRDAFEGLTRSINVLANRAGVGGPWIDLDSKSELLRQRSIQLACQDATKSLVSCCGMAVVYSLCAIAIGVATGISAQADLCGGPMEPVDGMSFISAPPVGIVLDQHLINRDAVGSDGEKTKTAFIDREVFAMSCTVDDNNLSILAFNCSVLVESPSSGKACEKLFTPGRKFPFLSQSC